MALLAVALAAPRVVLAQAMEPARSAAQQPLAHSAAQRETARTWVLEGRRSFAAQDYGAALERYLAAYQLVRVPTVGVEVARAQQALGQWVEANATAVEVINLPRSEAEPEVFEQARRAASDLWRSLAPRIPALQLDITPATATAQVQIDGEQMPAARGAMSFKLNPGTHQLRVSAPGYRPELRTATLVEQERQTLEIVLVADEPATVARAIGSTEGGASGVEALDVATMSAVEEAGSAARTRGYVALGVAGVAALVGGTTGVLAFSHKPNCPEALCFAEQRPEAERSRRFGNVATVSFSVALVAVAYGGWELLFNSAPELGASASRRPTQAALVPLERGALLQLSSTF